MRCPRHCANHPPSKVPSPRSAPHPQPPQQSPQSPPPNQPDHPTPSLLPHPTHPRLARALALAFPRLPEPQIASLLPDVPQETLQDNHHFERDDSTLLHIPSQNNYPSPI